MNTPAIEKWQHASLRTVNLPSEVDKPPEDAFTVDVEVTDNTDLIYGDPENGVQPQVPNELTAIAEKVEFEGISPEELKKLTPEERIQLSRYRVWLISDRLRRPTLTPEQVRKLPYEDQVAIFRVCTHSDLSDRVMLASFRGLNSGQPSDGNGKAPRSRAK